MGRKALETKVTRAGKAGKDRLKDKFKSCKGPGKQAVAKNAKGAAGKTKATKGGDAKAGTSKAATKAAAKVVYPCDHPVDCPKCSRTISR